MIYELNMQLTPEIAAHSGVNVVESTWRETRSVQDSYDLKVYYSEESHYDFFYSDFVLNGDGTATFNVTRREATFETESLIELTEFAAEYGLAIITNGRNGYILTDAE